MQVLKFGLVNVGELIGKVGGGGGFIGLGWVSMLFLYEFKF